MGKNTQNLMRLKFYIYVYLCGAISTVFTYIYSLLIENDLKMYQLSFCLYICAIFMGKVMLTINWGPGFLFIGEFGQQSKRWNLSVIVFLVLH